MLRDRSVFQETLTETENAADVEIFLVKSPKSRKVFNSTSKKHPHKFSIIHSPIPVLNIHNLNVCYMKSTCFHVHGPKPLCGFVELWIVEVISFIKFSTEVNFNFGYLS